MKPKCMNNKWYIEIYTEEFGDILLLDSTKVLSPLIFDEKSDAEKFINIKLKEVGTGERNI